MTLSDKAKEMLSKEGWYPGRKVDISKVVDELEVCELFDAARVFLTEFYGIELRYVINETQNIWGLLHFDPLRASGRCERVMYVYSIAIDKPLCIIGEMEQDVLVMDSDGKIYNVFEYDFFLTGDTSYEAIENILVRRERLCQIKFNVYKKW